MSRRGIAVVMGLAGLAAAAALVFLVSRAGDGEGEVSASTPLPDGLTVTTQLTPRNPLFGDTVRATVDVELDPTRVDPESIEMRPDFTPWERAGPAEVTRRDVGDRTFVRTAYTLRCTTGPCLPSSATWTFNPSPTRVRYDLTEADGETTRGTVRAVWPLLVVYSRFNALRLDPTATETDTRADLVSLPAVTYRVPAGVLVGAFGLVAALLAAAGAAFLYVAWPRRAPAPEPEPEPEPQPSLTPLEQALALLEESARAEGASEQRRALELVAEELEEWGDDDLSDAAKVLAWSAGAPGLEQTTELAARVRAELEQELLARAELERNGAGSAT